MTHRIHGPASFAAIIMAASGVLAPGSSARPAVVGDRVWPSSNVSCSKTAACQTYKNSNTGPGLEGDNTNQSSSATEGLLGTGSGYAFGVKGVSTSLNSTAGVLGVGNTNADGVMGNSTGPGSGVSGNSIGNGDGVDGSAQTGYGVAGFSQSYIGGFAETASTSWPAFYAFAESTAIDATGGAVVISSTTGNTSGFGLLSTTPSSGNAYPLVARDTGNNNLFYVDGLGDVYYHGSLNHFTASSTGNVSQTFTATTASPTIEDNGTARLINGVATVVLDSAFAHSIDLHRAYQVMLTPDGDTRGLYTAFKTPTSFTVREVQGGHGTLDFDYHIYAPALGQAGVRMREMTPAQAAATAPKPVRIPILRTPFQGLGPRRAISEGFRN